MKAVVWHGQRDMRVDDVPDPVIEEPTDVLIKVTSSGICGSDLHLYETLAPFMEEGDIVGHEPMGVVTDVGSEVEHVEPGDRVVIPFNVSCGHCWMCDQKLYSQCETTQIHEYEKGAAFLGYSKLYGQVPGGQAELLRVPQGHFGPIKVPEGPPDERFLYLSDVLPTAWQAVAYADPPEGGTVAVFGLGPIGQMSARVLRHKGVRVIGVDLVEERLAMARKYDVETIDIADYDGDISDEIRERTSGRGADATIDAVGMEAHGAPIGEFAQKAVGLLPDVAAEKILETAGVDRLTALQSAIDSVRRGGTVSISGVYGGTQDPLNLLQMFDKQIQLRMGQANVKRWIPEILPLLEGDEDPFGTEDFATNKISIDDAPEYYEKFQKKEDGVIKVVIQP